MGAKMRLTAAVAVLLLTFVATQIGAQNVTNDVYLLDPTNSTGNVTVTSNCDTLTDSLKCPDPNILFYLYSGNSPDKELVNVSDPEWFKSSKYDAALPTVMLIHGYRGGDSLVPMVILKNAYIRQGTYNLIMLDWGALAKVPCYLQTVGSVKAVAKCVAHLLSYLDTAGVDTENITCVGHSLGAHVCGLIANYATKKFDKIVGLDPARPLMSARLAISKLDAKDATKSVQVIHSNTGFYALSGMIGTVDFCVNNGAQPFCEKTRNDQLCSHLHAVCFYAESLDVARAHRGTPCNRCPKRRSSTNSPPASQQRKGDVTMGHHLEDSAKGMYCVTAPEAPYCLNATVDPNYGDIRCCPVYPPPGELQGTTPEPSVDAALLEFSKI